MKKIGAMLFVAILAVGLSTARAEDKKADTMAELKALDAKLTEGFQARDSKMLGKYTADDYILIDPRGGLHTKDKYLEYLSKHKPGKLADMKESDVKVRVFGDTGVVTGLLSVKGKLDDKDIGAEYRWTRAYNKKGEDWLCVLEQHTYVGKEDKK